MRAIRYPLVCLAGAAIGLGALAAQKGAGDAAKGKEVYEQCAVCHSANTDEKKMGPSLKGLYKKAKMTNGKKPTDATVGMKIDQGGNGMPAYKDILSADERKNLIAYLRTL